MSPLLAGATPASSTWLQLPPESVDVPGVTMPATPNVIGLQLSESLLTGLVLVGALLVVGIALVGVLLLFVLSRGRAHSGDGVQIVASGHEDPWQLAGHRRSMMKRSHGNVGSGSMSSRDFNGGSIHDHR